MTACSCESEIPLPPIDDGMLLRVGDSVASYGRQRNGGRFDDRIYFLNSLEEAKRTKCN